MCAAAMSKTVLIVEDEQAIADSIAYALRTDGFTPRHVTLGEQALAVLRSEAAPQLVVLDTEGSVVEIDANNDATVLLLSGEPIAEPIVGYGPFVMNTQQEIVDAVNDFNSGKFGRMSV